MGMLRRAMGELGYRKHAVWALLALAMAPVGAAWAQGKGQPESGGIGFQEPATPVMRHIVWFHDGYLIWILAFIAAFVLALLIIVMLRFNARTNPKPAGFSHNTLLEVVWTIVPVTILVFIAVPSFRLLFHAERIPEQVDLTVKATGYQWYWGYAYPDQDVPEYFSTILPDDKLGRDHFGNKQPRLLATDNDLVVPAGKTVRVIVTGVDVIHNFAVPAFGLKVDAVPGRLNEVWFRADQPGMYYGQCSELCGINHAYMPISVRVVAQAEFDRWIAEKRQQAGLPPDQDDVKLARASDAPPSDAADAAAK